MEFIKKQAAGFYLTALSAVMAAVSIICYFINCGTEYFSKMGMNYEIIICLVIAIALEILYIAGVNKNGSQKCYDVIPIVCGVFIMAAFVFFIVARITSIATIMSFEKNAQTMSDLSSAIAGLITCFLAVILNIAGAFCKTVKQ